jgi:hypothetical protein
VLFASIAAVKAAVASTAATDRRGLPSRQMGTARAAIARAVDEAGRESLKLRI